MKTNRKSTKTLKENRVTAFLPFINGVSWQLHRRLECRAFALSSAPTPQYAMTWSTQWTPIPDIRDGIVYGIHCGICNKVYIWETGKPVGLEHRRDIRLTRTDNSAMAENTYDAENLPNWSGVQCIAHDRHSYTRQRCQRDHPGNLSLLAQHITEFHSRQNQLMHCDLCDQSLSPPLSNTQQNNQSHINDQPSLHEQYSQKMTNHTLVISKAINTAAGKPI